MLQGCFDSFTIADTESSLPHEWSRIRFSNDGKYLMVSTKSEVIYILDAFKGDLVFRLTGHINRAGLDLEANFTPDGKFVFSGSQDGTVCIWDLDNGKLVAKLKAHYDPCTAIAWNPKYMMFASADTSLVCFRYSSHVFRDSGPQHWIK